VNRERWRYLDSGPLPGATNMALDQAILETHTRGEVPATLRVYAWRPPAVSLGRFQRMEEAVDLEACRQLGVDVVRRPTGGRAILHTAEEVTFSIVVSSARLGTRGVMDSYRALARAIAAGLRTLGLDARLVERASSAAAGAPAGEPACFAVKARCDLVVGGAKLVGSAQVQRGGFILQQNSLPLRIPLEDWRRVFRRADSVPQAVGLWQAAGRQAGYAEVAAALRAGCEQAFCVELAPGEPTESELRRAEALLTEA